ncbi:hypothetical protein [Janthinobacterium fluminis]|uniref:Uncharacterized protein n=1 Tax=Janthinobacterium fluminis TaxID=2987524 RepID=A0ABT5JXR8_9BURK|nr:hypothetical protein [Janthinobacterium fluminis]MDC8756342.1 hypothetical protein [Janthinobacterium fluminis]
MSETSFVTQQDIEEQRDSIEARLHSAQLALGDDMEPFQQQWHADPATAFVACARDGWNERGADWLDAQAALFDRDAWLELGGMVAKGEPPSSDPAGEGDDEWEWWHTAIAERPAATPAAGQAAGAATVLGDAGMAQKIYRHRDAVLALTTQIGCEGKAAVLAFLDSALADIDAELAAAIVNDAHFPVVLELLDDHDSALLYCAYAELMLEAIPPNFYAHVAGKGAPHLMLEVALLVGIAPLSTGNAVRQRIHALTERLERGNAGAAHNPARVAVETFIRVIDDFGRAADTMHALGADLIQLRKQSLETRSLTQRLRSWIGMRG